MDATQMNMLAYLLAAGGQDISSGNPLGENLNAATMNTIASQNKMKLLQDMLGGGAKIGLTKDKMTINGPASMMSVPGQQTPSFGGGLEDPLKLNTETQEIMNAYGSSGATGEAAMKATTPTGSPNISNLNDMASMAQLLNFSASSPEISNAALVGLTPKDVSEAFQTKLGYDQLRQKKFSDIADMAYKTGTLNISSREVDIKEKGLLDKLDIYPIEVPGLGRVTSDVWKSLDPDTKAYASYVAVSRAQNPDEPVMDMDEWRSGVAAETKKAYYELLLDNPEYMEIEKTLAESRATKISLSEKIGEQEAKTELEDRMYFTSPEGATADLDKFFKVNETTIRVADNEDRERARLAEGWMENKIVSAGHRILSSRLDGNTFVWEVEFKDGKVGEVRYVAKSN